MRSSFIILGAFVLGCIAALTGLVPETLIGGNLTTLILYLLMFQVGFGLGHDPQLVTLIKSVRPRLLLLPLATIAGGLLA